MRADEENDLAGVSPIVRPFAPRAGAGRTKWQPSDSAIDSWIAGSRRNHGQESSIIVGSANELAAGAFDLQLAAKSHV
jgi:hypothetical protein